MGSSINDVKILKVRKGVCLKIVLPYSSEILKWQRVVKGLKCSKYTWRWSNMDLMLPENGRKRTELVQSTSERKKTRAKSAVLWLEPRTSEVTSQNDAKRTEVDLINILWATLLLEIYKVFFLHSKNNWPLNTSWCNCRKVIAYITL